MTVFERVPSGKAPAFYVQSPILMDEGSVTGVGMHVDGATRLGVIDLQLSDAGRERFAEITRRNIGRRLAIIIGGQLYCAPVIGTDFARASILVTGDLGHDEASVLAGKVADHLRWDDTNHISAPQKGERPPIDAGEPAPPPSPLSPAAYAEALAKMTRPTQSPNWPDLPPRIAWEKAVKGPVAVKALADASVYVLNDSPPTFQWFDSNGTVRAKFDLTKFHPLAITASGFDVDGKGNAYIALTSLNEVLMLRPDGSGTYKPSIVFENGPELALHSPWDVAVSEDGSAIYVSDSSNHRLARLHPPWDAVFIRGFSDPRGLSLNATGEPLVADLGHQLVYTVLENNIYNFFPCPGALKVSATSEVVYVTDGISVKQYDSEYRGLLRELPASIGLKNPRSVSAWPVDSEQRVYIADYGNNRVVGVTFTRPDPIAVWNDMKKAAAAGDMTRTLSYFSADGVARYRAEFQAVGLAAAAKSFNQLTDISVDSMTDFFAYCKAFSLMSGKKIQFYINFSNENGVWKIDSF